MSVTINCPKCSAGLKLPDRSVLGRKGKCPQCRHRFILEEPDEVQLELAEPEAPTGVTPDPMVGTSAKWIPDEPPAGDAVFPGAAAVSATDPAPASPAIPAADAPPANPFDFSAPPDSNEISQPAVPDVSASAVKGSEGSAGDRTPRRRRRSNTGPIVVGVGTALFVFCMIGLWWQQSTQAKQDGDQQTTTQTNQAWENEKEDLAASNDDARALSPTKGGPIPVDYMPFTPHLLFHIRPAEVWARDRRQQEFTTLLYGLNTWLTDKIREVTRFEPEEIEELTFAMNFGSRTVEPDVAAVVRLVSEQSASDLQLKRFRGQVRPDLPVKIHESDAYSYMMLDAKTFAVAPVTMSDALADAKKFSRQPSVELEVLLKETDRKRQMTLMFDLTNIDTHREFIFNENLHQLSNEFVLWFGRDIQTVSWSAHLGPEKFFMETLLHNSAESSPLRVQRHMKGRLSKFPEQIFNAVRMMKPGSNDRLQLIGRFPAMLQATMLGTSTHVGAQYVRMVTLLPARAAPNLAAASMLAWDQSLVTDFDGPAPVAISRPQLPEKIIDRLKQVKVYVDFSGTPLQEALQYVAEEIQTTLEIDGDGLKKVALTQNMRQNHKLGDVTAMKAFDVITTNPDYRNMMVMVVDENAKKILITSRPAAEEAGMEIFDTKQ